MLEKRPNSVELKFGLATLHYNAERYYLAQLQFEKVLSVCPHMYKAMEGLAWVGHQFDLPKGK